MPLALAALVLAGGVLLELDRLGWVELDSTWCFGVMSVVAGAGLLAVTRESTGALYTGTLARWAELNELRVWPLRLATIATAPIAGVGVAAYTALSLVESLVALRDWRPAIDWRRSSGTGLLGLGAVLLCTSTGYQVGDDELLWSVLLASAGLSLVWWLPDRRRDSAPDRDRTLTWVLGVGLVAAAVLLVLGSTGLFSEAGANIVGTAAAIAVLALVVGPRWLRTSRALAAERLERARATERAEVAGILHDSVLQTLALIQTRADDPAEVLALSRRQERELRAWLLERHSIHGPPRSIASALRAVAAEVEDVHQVKIDVVTVGDRALDESSEALIAAAREALVNAAKHAPGSPISLFGEIEERRVSAYVRDRGPGFDLDSIPADRRGVRDSIFARMVRNGGNASVRTAPGGGCEVRLVQEGPR